MCEDNSRLKFLVIMYNKSVKEHAEKIFPNNATCRTAHSLAMEAVGKLYRHKGFFNLKPIDVIRSEVTRWADNTHEGQKRAGQIVQTIENFMNSTDEELEHEHVPSTWEWKRKIENISAQNRNFVLDGAHAVWKVMIDR